MSSADRRDERELLTGGEDLVWIRKFLIDGDAAVRQEIPDLRVSVGER